MALALIFIKLTYEILKNKRINHYSLLSLLNIKLAFCQISTKSVDISDLDEGMVLKKYFFKSKEAYDAIKDETIKNSSYHNLNVGKEDDLYCFFSLNRIGLTKEDIIFINDLYQKDLIKNPNFQIRIGIPFLPFITLGYIGFLVFGDLIAIISDFIKAFF